jgi:predicted NUDIX family NTP pyrophosphohydrolase
MRDVPEIDRVGFFEPAEARIKLNPAQAPFIDRALALLP